MGENQGIRPVSGGLGVRGRACLLVAALVLVTGLPLAATPPAGAATVIFAGQSFDGVTAPALPAEWTATRGAGPASDGMWRTATPAVTTGSLAAFVPAQSHVTDQWLDSPVFYPDGNTSLAFHHQVWLQPGYDGGVLEIKVGTGSYTDFVTAGGVFRQDGYERAINLDRGSPIRGRNAWSSQVSSGGSSAPTVRYTTATLPASAAGKPTQLRWRMATDTSSGGGGYWRVDSIVISKEQTTVSINQAAGQADPARTASASFTAVFSAPVAGFTGSDVRISGTAPGTKAVTVTGGPATYTVAVSGMTGPGTVVATIPADVVHGFNLASTSSDNQVTYEPAATVTINQKSGQADPTTGAAVTFRAVFSRAVTGFTGTDVTVAGTATGTKHVTVTPVSSTTYDVAVTGMLSSGTVTAAIPANVIDGGPGANLASTSTDGPITYTRTTPGVTINQATTQTDPAATASVTFDVVFSQAVTGFTTGDVIVGGTAPGTKTVTVTPVAGTANRYAVTVTGMTGIGTVLATVPANVVTGGNTASTSTDNTVTYLTPATVTINQNSGQADPTTGAAVTFRAAFNRAVTGFAGTDVTVGGTATGTKHVTVTPVAGSTTAFDVAVSGMLSSGTVTVAIPANVVDGGNSASTSQDRSITYTRTTPGVTINQAATQTDPAPSPSVTFDVVFSQAVTGFSTGDVTVGGTAPGTKAISIVPVAGTANRYTVTVTGLTGFGTVVATVPANVVTGGNAASTSTDNTVTHVTPATVTINQKSTQADFTSASALSFTAVFSRAVTGFTGTDVTVGGTATGTKHVTVTPVAGSTTTFDVVVTGMLSSGTVTVAIPANVVDGGNAVATSLDRSVTYDRTTPGVTIDQAATQTDPSSTATVDFDVVFSQAVTGFATGDVTVAGSAPGTKTVTVTPVAGTANRYTVTVAGATGAGTVSATVPANVVDGGNTASTSADNVVSLAATVTIVKHRTQFTQSSGATIRFQASFGAPVTGLTASDVVISGTATGTKHVTVAPVVGIPGRYDIEVTGMLTTGTVIASLPANVVDGGNAAATSSDVITYQRTTPTVTINRTPGTFDPTSSLSISFDVTFSQAVTGFAAGDVTVGGTAPGTKSVTVTPVAGTANRYTVTVTGMTGAGTVSANVLADVVVGGNRAAVAGDTVTYQPSP